MDLFPIKLYAKGTLLSLVAIVLGLALNALLWLALSFLLAYGAAKGWAAAQ